MSSTTSTASPQAPRSYSLRPYSTTPNIPSFRNSKCCVKKDSCASVSKAPSSSSTTTSPLPPPETEQGPTSQLFSNRFEADGITFEKPNPNFFSFNNPYGACPTCGGYGSTTGISEDLVVPNRSLSIYDDAVVCWRGDKMSEWKTHLIRLSTKINFPIHTPYSRLTPEQLDILWHGTGAWEGIDGFFNWIESQSYKIQYRVMLSRYRGKTTCPTCHGSRLRPDTEYVKICGRSISQLLSMPVSDFAQWLNTIQAEHPSEQSTADAPSSMPSTLSPHERQIVRRLLAELTSRVGYLLDVGLGYLTLNRPSNTLSGGESQRINLATSLGSSLVGSMYILDEPSIGLHSRDTHRLIRVLKQPTISSISVPEPDALVARLSSPAPPNNSLPPTPRNPSPPNISSDSPPSPSPLLADLGATVSPSTTLTATTYATSTSTFPSVSSPSSPVSAVPAKLRSSSKYSSTYCKNALKVPPITWANVQASLAMSHASQQ